jgi:hypothetical protein
VYLVGYLSFGVPVILAGLLITPLGLTTTVAAYGAVIVITAAATVGPVAGPFGRRDRDIMTAAICDRRMVAADDSPP